MATKRYTTMPAIVEFEGVQVCIIDRQGKPWVALTDLTRALYGLKATDRSVGTLRAPLRAIGRVFAKNADEFTDDMTSMLTLETPGGPQQVRIFSARGAYLVGMLAKTDRAKRFRRWVLDVLEGKIDVAAQQRRGPMTSEQIDQRLRLEEAKLAIRALDALRRASGNRAAALAAPAIYRAFGVNIDPDASDTLAQGELPLDETTVH